MKEGEREREKIEPVREIELEKLEKLEIELENLKNLEIETERQIEKVGIEIEDLKELERINKVKEIEKLDTAIERIATEKEREKLKEKLNKKLKIGTKINELVNHLSIKLI